VGRVRADFDRHWRETIRTIVEEGQREGEFGDVDAGEFAVVLSALLDGFAIQIALDDDTVQAAKAFELSMRFAADRLSFEWSTSTRMGGRAEGRSQVAAGTAS
jgi:BetI-type transcriptional repressor, C-terminal